MSKGRKVCGFRNDKRITVRVTDRSIDLVLTKHCIDKIRERIGEKESNKSYVEKAIKRSWVIKDRSRSVKILLSNHLRKSLYLYYKGLVLVLEEDTVSKQYRILKTAYDGANSGWVQEWLNDHVGEERIPFSKYFDSVEKLKVE
jgi:hypothetical protein